MTKRFERTSRALGQPRKPIGARPTPNEFRAFVLLSEELHFGRAAARRGLAQSSLSETIRRLEAKLDVVLFERTSRRVLLTEAGVGLLPIAREVLASLDAVSLALAPPEGSEDVLRVGMEGHGFAELNRHIFGGLQERHPGTSLRVREVPGTPQAFIDGRHDVALVRSPLEDDRIVSHPIATEERGVLVPERHAAAGADAVPVEELFDEPFVALAPTSPVTSGYWLASDLRGGERPRVGGEAHNTRDALDAIAYGGLLTTGTASAVRAFPFAPIGFVDVLGLKPETLSVVARAGDDRPIVREFIEMVRAIAAEFAEDLPGVGVLSPS